MPLSEARGYSPMRHLASAVFLGRRGKGCYMAVFHAYFDTGGTESAADGTVLVTAGLVATDTKWERFDRRWKAALTEFGVAHLHMKDFAQCKGEYASWKGDEAKRAAFLDRLIREVKRGINRAFVTAVILPDYRQINSRYRFREEGGGPYATAQSATIVRVSMWLDKKKRHSDQCGFFIEHGDAGQGAFRQFIKKAAGIEPVILPRRAPDGQPYTPLEACDLLAYEYRHEYHRIVSTKLRPRQSRKSLQAVRRMLPLDVGIFDAEALEACCREGEITPRAADQ